MICENLDTRDRITVVSLIYGRFAWKKGLSIVLVASFLSSNFAQKYIFSTSFPLLLPKLELTEY